MGSSAAHLWGEQMKKPSTFRWAYDGAELRSDPTMTRQRLSRLVRAWRKHGHTVTRQIQGNARVFTVRAGQWIARSEVTA